jgi:nicotinamidase-related amidase/type 1 glutamine amidotransferase
MLRRRLGRWTAAGIVAALAIVGMAPEATAQTDADPSNRLMLTLRSRVDSPGLGGASRVVETGAAWDARRTAIIVCDMWDLHHCLNATRRVGELAPRMDEVLKAARARGATVIHAPSSCTDAYKDHPARLRARAAPRSKSLPTAIGQWCKQIPAEEKAAYPVDQREGGEDDDLAEHARWAARLASLGRNPRAPWKTQTSALTIDERADYISDDGEEIWSVLEDRGINNVILMGVHLNMCVLGRPFGLRQMVKNGKNVALMRDMTDTMYDPRKAPFVSHFTGTDRMVEHVERFVCPSVTSDQILGGKPFRFKGDTRPRIAFLVAEDEYKTETSLPPFASIQLGKDYKVSFIFDSPTDKNELQGLSALDDADLLLVSARRRVLPTPQIDAVRRFVAAGKAVVGIRTASHAFAARGNEKPPARHGVWPTFDPEVLGGHYTGHHKEGPKVAIALTPEGSNHPICTGVDVASLVGQGSLYKVAPLASSATPILTGTIPGEPSEPILWTNVTSSGGRVVYCSLGHVDDFAQPAFQRLLRNAIDWAVGRDVPARVDTASTEAIPFPK